jgi:hypothetical protein
MNKLGAPNGLMTGAKGPFLAAFIAETWEGSWAL